MKPIHAASVFLFSLFLLSALLCGCASTGAYNTESMLSAAGFTVKTPKNAQEQAIYDKLKAYKMETGVVNGKRLYGYKDEKKGVVFVGGEEQYQAYQRLAIQQNIATERMRAAQMDALTVQQYRSFAPYGYRR